MGVIQSPSFHRSLTLQIPCSVHLRNLVSLEEVRVFIMGFRKMGWERISSRNPVTFGAKARTTAGRCKRDGQMSRNCFIRSTLFSRVSPSRALVISFTR